jgi:hypothetical protein
VDLAKVVLETRDRPKAEDVALTLKDLSQQFEHKQIALMRAAVSPRQHARERVDGWTEFFSAEVLPCFWTAVAAFILGGGRGGDRESTPTSALRPIQRADDCSLGADSWH